MHFDALVARITALPPAPTRRLIAVAGPPASGKSTLAAQLAGAIDGATALPMDGFHLDDALLIADGTWRRKGAPHTFDAHGFVRLIAALQEPADLIFPIFDRSRELAIAGAGRVPATCDTVVVEGNYLMLNDPPWDALRAHWSLSIALTPDRATLRDRLTRRWHEHGKPDAAAWIDSNDMPNIDTVLTRSAPADITLTGAPT
ncbi:MAG: nucleoside/nucleotide kinase family protein [Pseudomonadota bacterium]